ncbi:MAG: hypothetical protein QOG71_3425 [Pyrinomonadaceae bacterium]|nr:hypothetical protein [Pyrinomonadaceae bacterium]
MATNITPTEVLAREFLQKAAQLHGSVEPIRILKARAYKIGDASVLIRAASEGNRRYFFGLNYIHAEEVANLDNPFFVFICGSSDRTLIVPAQLLLNNLPNISHDRNGEYKINIDQDLNIVLSGRGNRLDCSTFINSWSLLLNPPKILARARNSVEESLHSVVQGRLLEIGNVRGYHTFCPNKSKKFNGKQLLEIASLPSCPELQFSQYNLLRQIDVLWFREKNQNLIPECAFEVELSTGTWSGVGRMATLIDYANVRLYVISNEQKKYQQVMTAFAEFQSRYRHIDTESIGELYAAELNLRQLRSEIGL